MPLPTRTNLPTLLGPKVPIRALWSQNSKRPIAIEGILAADPDRIHPSLRAAIENAIEAEAYPIVISGGVGTGKSCAAACLFTHWPCQPRWFDAAQLINLVVDCRRSPNGVAYRTRGHGTECTITEDELFAKVDRTPLVILDDLAVRELTPAGREVIRRFVDCRAGKPFVVTTNANAVDLRSVTDDRIASRLLSGTLITVSGKDQRIEALRVVKV